MKPLKRILKTAPRSALMATVLILLLCTVALAATVLVIINSDMNIVPGEVSAGAYLDPDTTVEITAVHWGDIARGTHQEFVFYIKNTGVEDIEASMSISGNVSDIMTYSFTPSSAKLSAGEVATFTFEADILPTAALGSRSWDFQVSTP